MIIYVSESLSNVLTEEGYKDLLKNDCKSYGFKSIEEAQQNEWDYKKLNLSIEVGEKFELIELDKMMENEMNEQLGLSSYETSLSNNSADTILDNNCIDFNLTNSDILRIEFDIIERYSDEDEENEISGVLAENSEIEITKIYLV